VSEQDVVAAADGTVWEVMIGTGVAGVAGVTGVTGTFDTGWVHPAITMKRIRARGITRQARLCIPGIIALPG
jgi:hypothetical protein